LKKTRKEVWEFFRLGVIPTVKELSGLK